MNDQEKKERIREEIATDILGYHLGTPIDSYGTPRVPQPVWCNDKRCKKYKENCEYCITDKILATEGVAILADNQELPHPEMLPFELDPQIPMVSKAGIALQKNISNIYSLSQQDMLRENFRRIIECP